MARNNKKKDLYNSYIKIFEYIISLAKEMFFSLVKEINWARVLSV